MERREVSKLPGTDMGLGGAVRHCELGVDWPSHLDRPRHVLLLRCIITKRSTIKETGGIVRIYTLIDYVRTI